MSLVANFNRPQATQDEASFLGQKANSSASSPAHVVAVASGKGGVGKTSLSANLSIALSQQGHRVCLFDADTSLANVNILLNVHPEYTLEHFVSGGYSIDDILLTAPGGIDIVPGATGITDLLELSNEQQKRLLKGLRILESKYDYLIIDTAAGVNETLLKFLTASPHIILTITHEPTSLTDAFSLLKIMKSKGIKKKIHVIVNMAQNRHIAHSTYKRFKRAVAKYLRVEVIYLGFVFADEFVAKAVTHQHPFLLRYHTSMASRCIKGIAQRVTKIVSSEDVGDIAFSDFFKQLRKQNKLERALDKEREGRIEPSTQLDLSGSLSEQLANVSHEEGATYLRESVQAWLAQFERFPASIRQALSHSLTNTRAATRDSSLTESKVEPPELPEPLKKMQSSSEKDYAALLAAAKVAAKLSKS